MNQSNPNLSSPEKHKAKFKVNKFVIGGVLLMVAVILLAVTALKGNAQYYLTVDELLKTSAKQTQNVRISGVVLGDSINYDPQTLTLSFTIANIPGDTKTIDQMGGLAFVLHQSASDPLAKQLKVVYNGVKPDLLNNEAQAIITGSLRADGIFVANELLLKCPTRYEDSIPAQASS